MPERSAAADAPRDLTEDRLLGGRVAVRQPRRGHRAGSDAILLAASVPAVAGERAIDLGAGVGTAGLALHARAGARVLLVEIDPALAGLAVENVDLNRAGADVMALIGDAATLRPEAAAGFAPADHVLANPPFNPPTGRRPPDPRTARARVAEADTLDAWARTAARLLRPGGSFTMICRADGVAAALASFESRFGGLALRFVHGREGEPAVRLLIGGWRGSRAPLRVLPPLVLNGADGRLTAMAEAIHRDAEPLPLLAAA
ncbi:MAG TPA: methyltransferase [Hyphomicrobiales bacterium]|nr:methyltransferase [Hyphomicrobiales bacterium]